MTELLRAALLEAPSLNAIEKSTGVRRQTLASFMRGEQVSIHLASADALAAYFGIVCVQSDMPAPRDALPVGIKLISTAEAARLLGVSMGRVRQLALLGPKQGGFASWRAAPTALVFDEAEIRRHAKRQAQTGRPRGGFKAN